MQEEVGVVTHPNGVLPADAPRRRLILMRHGDVAYFDDGGRPLPPNDVPLSARGRVEARAAGKRLADAGIPFDRVIVSGLPRTVETAALVCAVAGRTPPVHVQPDLQEIRAGRLDAIPGEALPAAFLGAFDGGPNDACTGAEAAERRFLGGERVGDFIGRVVPAFQAILHDASWQCLLLVLHGGVNRVILTWLIDGRARLASGLEQDSGCINMVDVSSDGSPAVVRLLNFSPLDPLQTSTRQTTMERLLTQYLRHRRAARFSEGGGAARSDVAAAVPVTET